MLNLKNKLKVTFLVTLLMITSNNVLAIKLQCASGQELLDIGVDINGDSIKECVNNENSDVLRFEDDYNFDKEERTYWNTDGFNCHGLAYYNRQGRINYPNHLVLALIQLSAYKSLTNAIAGDRGVLFVQDDIDGDWTINGKKYYISHSWIFQEDYDGTSTTVRSKYGGYPEYVHGYGGMMNVYENNSNDIVLVLPFGTSSSSNSTSNIKNSKESFIANIIKIPYVADAVIALNQNSKLEIDNLGEEFFSNVNNQVDLKKEDISYKKLSDKDIIDSLSLGDLSILQAGSDDKTSLRLLNKNAKIKELLSRKTNLKENIINKAITESGKFQELLIKFAGLIE